MGGGVMVFDTDRIMGGDAGNCYLGEYNIGGDAIEAKINGETAHELHRKCFRFNGWFRIGWNWDIFRAQKENT